MNLYGPKQLADSMRTVRENTILIAKDIPEEKYSYRPTQESRSVAETLLHIVVSAQAAQQIHGQLRVASLENFDFRGLVNGFPIKEKDQRSKSEIISLLQTEGDRWGQWLEQVPEPVLAGPARIRARCRCGTKSPLQPLSGA